MYYGRSMCLVLMLFLITAFVYADDGETVNNENDANMFEYVLERSMSTFGGALTLGEKFQGIGAGVVIADFHIFLSGNSNNGLYLLFFANPIFRLLYPDNVQINDLKLLGISYRGETFIENLGFEAGLSFTKGSRRIDNTTYGDWYLGLAPEVGLYFPHRMNIDFGVSFCPVIHLYSIYSTDVLNRSYLDIIFKVTFKNFFKKYPRKW